MKKFSLLVALLVLFAACTSKSPRSLTLEDLLENPLYAEQYGDHLTDRMVELQIRADPLTQDPRKKEAMEKARLRGLDIANAAERAQRQGALGSFVSIEEETIGEVLVREGKIHFGPGFITAPGPGVSIVLSEIIDPRDIEFPDPTSLVLRRLESAYGTQTYDIPTSVNLDAIRTVVLWDTALERIHGFAQLSR